jgi:phosphoglycerate kinase
VPADLPRLDDLAFLRGECVLVRVDFNVPLRNGVIDDDLRITTALPTINWLRERGARVVACGHLGRPKGRPDPAFSMAPVARRLAELLRTEVPLAPSAFGPDVEGIVASASPGSVVLLENLRYHVGEEANDPDFAVNLVDGSPT